MSFTIPDWGDNSFSYPVLNKGRLADNDTTTKTPKNKKRKHNAQGTPGTLEREWVDNCDVPQTLKKRKTSKSKSTQEQEEVPRTDASNGCGLMKVSSKKKKKKKQATGEEASLGIPQSQEKDKVNNTSRPHGEADRTEVEVGSTPHVRKRKKKRKNNKYKELNMKQNAEKAAQGNSTGDGTCWRVNAGITKATIKEPVLAPSPNKTEETAQGAATPVSSTTNKTKKKKKKKSKLLEGSGNDAPLEDHTRKKCETATASLHQSVKANVELSVDQGDNADTNTLPDTSIRDQKKKKRKKSNNDSPASGTQPNGKETPLDPENAGLQVPDKGEMRKTKKMKNKDKGRNGNKGKTEDAVCINGGEKSGKRGKAHRKTEKADQNVKVGESRSNLSTPPKMKTKEQATGKKSSKKKQQSGENKEEEEELMFDSEDECDEEFRRDFSALLTKLNFSHFQGSQKGQGKGTTTASTTEKEGYGDDGEQESDMDDSDSSAGEEESECEDERSGLTGSDKKEEEFGKVSKKKDIKEPRHAATEASPGIGQKSPPSPLKKGAKFDRERLSRVLEEAESTVREVTPSLSPAEALKQKMASRLTSAKFRLVNEELYTSSSAQAVQLFRKDPVAFTNYHEGYRAQVRQWPVNPLDLVVKWLKTKPKEWVVADMGCGEAALAQQVPQVRVHSLDLVAANPRVTVCDMAHTPLGAASVDVVVFCLSLMGTNLTDFLVEANRVLREGGIMKIAEVESRCEDVKQFEKQVTKLGFHCTGRDTAQRYFFLLEFKKNRKLKKTMILPELCLKPCVYKKR